MKNTKVELSQELKDEINEIYKGFDYHFTYEFNKMVRIIERLHEENVKLKERLKNG